MDDFVPRSEYMERIGRSDDRMRDFDRRLSKVEEFGDKLQSMALSLERMVTTLQNMQDEQKEQGERLKKIEEVPGDKWNTAVKIVLTVIITAAATWLFLGGK